MQKTKLRVDRLSQLGEGVAQLDGRSVFIPGVLPGEELWAEISEEGAVLRGKVLALVRPSPGRRPSPCVYGDRCGGCDWLHVTEAIQETSKQDIVLSALEHLGNIERSQLQIHPLIQSPRPMGYRRRAVLHFHHQQLSFHQKKSHDSVAIKECLVLVPELQRLPEALSVHLGSIAKHVEEVHLLAEGAHAAFAVFLRGPVTDRLRDVCEQARRATQLRGAVVVPKQGSPVLLGKPVLRVQQVARPDVPLFERPDAFCQANAEGNVLLVNVAVGMLALDPQAKEHVLELFSGNGNFTFSIAEHAAEVTGVESSNASIELAGRSVREGGIRNVRLILGDAEKVCRGLGDEKRRFPKLLADPPRTGMPTLARYARALAVERLVYVACDAAALARDARVLQEQGFTPEAIQVLDLFPQTRHVEAVMSFVARPKQPDPR